ncbi:galactan beta-1,4-galactosyltransferase GALS3-like isoform X2 [Telopea speciosissima]|uniref:galactan beta-1,4-galactosyltransferase GALS3-like isoform X2 n=1 Tax=Telopea speciosissima TaxID=54955 RepID=UPI001CC5C13C|nr:galactan beta-1,4-galactosyltransferase GALS3-like isoform X2 [Telopea speciosissima]
MTKKEKEKKMFDGAIWNCAAELKLLLTAFLFLSSLAVLLQFIPSRLSSLSPPDFRLCLSTLSTLAPAPSSSSSSSSASVPLPPPSPKPSINKNELINGSIIKRALYPYGAAAYSFVQTGAYRGGLHTFAIVGLASKPLHVYGKPLYECRWFPDRSHNKTISTVGTKILPDWGYGRVYTVVVVNCTFTEPVGADGSGGRLVLVASTNGGGDRDSNVTEEIEVLNEAPGSLNTSIFTSSPPYDYLYCGSPLYGNLSPQRIREWMAYHVKLLGEKSHYVIYDAGGVHPGVLEVLKPWMETGYVTLQDIREQERFDGYYHNQFLVVNDCLHRYKFMAKWMFFFDLDEYIYVLSKRKIGSVLDSLSDYTQFTFEQMPMSNKLCLAADNGKTHTDVKRVARRDRKYAVQPRNVYATGVHMSQNVGGKTLNKADRRIKYFHYHDTIAERHEPCRQLVNTTELTFEGTPYVLDNTMRRFAASVKRFELNFIGTRLQTTPQ